MSVDELEMRGEEEMKGEIAEDILGLSITEALLYLFKKNRLIYFTSCVWMLCLLDPLEPGFWMLVVSHRVGAETETCSERATCGFEY